MIGARFGAGTDTSCPKAKKRQIQQTNPIALSAVGPAKRTCHPELPSRTARRSATEKRRNSESRKTNPISHLTSIRQYGEQRRDCFRGPGAVEIQIARVEQPLRLDVTHRRQEGFFEMRIILFEIAEQRP